MQYNAKNKFLLTVLMLSTLGLSANNDQLAQTKYQKEVETLRSASSKILSYQEEKNSILSSEAIADLNLIVGKKKGDTSLLDKISRTKTYFGYESLRYLLSNPLKDKKALLKRQAFIKKFRSLSNKDEIEKNLDIIAQNEKIILKLYADPINLSSDFLSLSTQLVGLDKYSVPTELARIGAASLTSTLAVATGAYSFFKTCKLGGFIYRGLTNLNRYNPKSYGDFALEPQDVIGLGISLGLVKFVKDKMIPSFKAQENNSRHMLEDLISVNRTLEACANLSEELEELKESSALIYSNNFKVYTQSFEGLSNEVKSLIKTIKTNTFKKVSNFKFMGRVRVAYKKFHELKSNFVNLFKAIGELDAYISFARLIDEHREEAVHYCFTQYLDNDLPIVRFKNAWHPAVEQTKIISHTLNLGSNADLILNDHEIYCPNVFLTAPNGAGKSTVLLQIALNVILSQTFGIAAADEFKTTLFDSIVIHSNIEHNAKEGQSTYAVEQEKMKQLGISIKSGCNNHKKVLAIIDEPFKSTKEELASVCLDNFMKDIEFYDKSICLIASHFLIPGQKVEERNNGRFINLHIPVYEEPSKSGTFKRGFKLEKGIDENWFNQSKEDSGWMERYDAWLAFTKLIK
ncbi:MutS-related protein [Candidatus Babela massiliensis]|uniref:Mismatch repair ATPase MutS family n=1 Tax=Candidatus Babela massiliensis TaxID=673862 RepID=V6DIL9_9BACT|nr:Mismatch repair ATPase MutS family [Candidatus Babela massiliensis]CDK30371.1 Mismatch repair ATPase MutS family [Candidatus Babela massiliensis]